MGHQGGIEVTLTDEMRTLTDDQRHVLAAYDPSMLADLIVVPEYGLPRIKYTHAGGTAGRVNGPEWLRWYSTNGSGIHGGDIGHDPKVSIGYTQMTGWAAAVAADIRAKVTANRLERIAEQNRTYGWCWCPWQNEPPNAHSEPCKRHHPTDDENSRYTANSIRLRTYMQVYIKQAIWWSEQPMVEQLDLFTEATA